MKDYDKVKAQGSPFDSLIQDAANAHGVSYDLLHKQLFAESSFNPKAKSPTGPRGIGQFTKATGKAYGLLSDEDFYDPAKSIDAAARHMKDNLKAAGGDELKALLMYNQGAGPVGRKQLEAYDRGDFSGVSEEGRNYMAKMADVATTGRRDELVGFVKDSSGFEAPAGMEPQAKELGDAPPGVASMSITGKDVQAKAPTFAEELYRTTGKTEDETGKGIFEGTGKAASAEVQLSQLGVAIRAATQSEEFDFTEAYTRMRDAFNDPFEGGRLSDWTDEDYEKVRSSGLDPQFYDVVLRGYRSNLDENLELALENQRLEQEAREQGIGAQIAGGAAGMVGDPWTLVNPARGAGAGVVSRLAGGAAVGGAVGGFSERGAAKVSGREDNIGMAIAGGALLGGALNGALGARPGKNSWDAPSEDLMGADDFKGLMAPRDTAPVSRVGKWEASGGERTRELHAEARLAGNVYTAQLRDGADVSITHLQDGDGGSIEVTANGEVIGGLEYGITSPENPSVYVTESWRRKGIASLLYDEAEKAGGQIPPLGTKDARSDMAQAFREAREAGRTSGATVNYGRDPYALDVDQVQSQSVRLEAREKARVAGLEDDPTAMPFRPEVDTIKEDAAVPYMDVPFDEGAARLPDGTIVSGGSPLNPKTLKEFRELDPEPVRANRGISIGSLTEIGYTLGRSADLEVRGLANDLYRAPTGYMDGSNGKFGATASDIFERLRSQDHVAHNQFRSTLDEALKDPYWAAQQMSAEAKMEQISRRVVEALENGPGNRTLSQSEQKLLKSLQQHMQQKWSYIENPGQFGDLRAKSLLEESRHQGSYFPQRYDTATKQMMIRQLGGADELQEAISRSWLASYAKRPEVRVRVDKMVEEKLKAEGIEKPTPQQITEAVQKYAKDKAYGISHTDQFNRSSLVDEYVKDGDGVGLENNAYLEARNLFDSDVAINLPDGSLFSVNDLREFNIMRVVPQYDRRVNGDVAIMGGTGKTTAELKSLAVKLKQKAGRDKDNMEADALMDSIRLFTGRARRPRPEDAWETMLRSLMDVGFMTKNAFMGVQNFTEAASLIVKGHTKMLLKGVPVLKKLTTAGTKLSPDDIKQVHGMVFGKELDDLIRPSRHDIVDRLRERHGEFWSQVAGSTKWATGEMSARSPFTWLLRETGNYIMDAARQGIIVDLADNVLNGTKSSLFSDARLRSASITPEQMQGIEDLIKAHFKRTKKGKWSLKNPEALANDPRAMDLWRLGDAVADEAILRPHKVSSQMTEQKSAYWAAALQFKMFVIRSLNARLVRGFWEGARGGKQQAVDQVMKAIVSVGLATGFYAGQAHVKALGMPERARRDYLNRALHPDMLAYAAMSRSSHIGAPLGTANFLLAPLGSDMAAQVRTSILPRDIQKGQEDRPIKWSPLQSSSAQGFMSRSLEQVPAAQTVASLYQLGHSAVGAASDTRGADAQGYRTGLWNALRQLTPNDPVSQNLLLRLAEANGVDRTR